MNKARNRGLKLFKHGANALRDTFLEEAHHLEIYTTVWLLHQIELKKAGEVNQMKL
jgi:hypothetical protein